MKSGEMLGAGLFNGPMPRLRIVAVLCEAARDLVRAAPCLLPALVLPTLTGMVLVSMPGGWGYPASLVPLSLIGISTIRAVSLGRKGLPNAWGVYFGRRERNYLVALFFVAVAMFFYGLFLSSPIHGLNHALRDMPMVRLGVVATVLVLVWGFAMGVAACWGIILPTIALGGRSSDKTLAKTDPMDWISWCRGNEVRLAVAFSLGVLPVLALTMWLANTVGRSLPYPGAWIFFGRGATGCLCGEFARHGLSSAWLSGQHGCEGASHPAGAGAAMKPWRYPACRLPPPRP